MVKMGTMVMKNDDDGYNEHQDDGGWDMMDEEDGGYIMGMTMIRHDDYGDEETIWKWGQWWWQWRWGWSMSVMLEMMMMMMNVRMRMMVQVK